MRLRIRGKFIGILLIVAVLPLCIAIIGIEILGFRYYKRERGRLFQSTALHLASALNLTVAQHVNQLRAWDAWATPARSLEARQRSHVPEPEDQRQRRIASLDARWPKLSLDSPELASLLTNSLAGQLAALQRVDPLLAEVFLSDDHGEIVAMSEKTSDYWQADELWWQRAMQARHSYAYLEGVAYDESARVFSLDVCLPIRVENRPYDPPLGVLKAVLNASPLFASVPRIPGDERPQHQVILAGGEVVFELYRDDVPPLHERVAPAVAAQLAGASSGWLEGRLDDRGRRLIGYARLDLGQNLVDKNVPAGTPPMFVIVHDDLAHVMSPVWRQWWLVGGTGTVLILACCVIGLYIASRKLLGPIEVLRTAARAIAHSAQLQALDDEPEPAGVSPRCAALLEQVRRIATHDEIEDLAGDFGSMAQRVLRYHEHLEEEIAAQTAEIQRDLQFAREFQEAFMPRSYPQVGGSGSPNELSLSFHHVYKPTSSVGGDFFDVIKLSEHQAGIFIADVMGHGARSALVTAILRALLQDIATRHGTDPARFLSDINQHFYGITSQSSQFIFVSAFYLVIDTQRSVASYASAGHPSPLLADRAHRQVLPLIERLQNNPALGLYKDSKYTNYTRFIQAGDVFVLFTDGVIEATGSNGEDYGRQRLRQVLEDNLDLRVADLCEALLDSVNQWTDSAILPDDLCIVGVEALAASAVHPPVTHPAVLPRN